MHSVTSTLHSGTQLTGSAIQANMQAQALQAPSTSAAMLQAIPSRLPTPPTEQHAAHFTSDGIVPNVSQSVAQVLASYKVQTRQDVAQGKAPTKKSVCYNTTEAVAIVS